MAQVVVARQKTGIKRLTKTFLTLSLEDVAARVGMDSPAEAERQLVSMIEEGSIFATISQKDGKTSLIIDFLIILPILLFCDHTRAKVYK